MCIHNFFFSSPHVTCEYLQAGLVHLSGVMLTGSIAALYRDDETSSGSSFYAGIVAEAPSIKNNKR